MFWLRLFYYDQKHMMFKKRVDTACTDQNSSHLAPICASPQPKSATTQSLGLPCSKQQGDAMMHWEACGWAEARACAESRSPCTCTVCRNDGAACLGAGVGCLEPDQGGVEGLLRPFSCLPPKALVVLAVQVRLLLLVTGRYIISNAVWVWT
jgi:hypothetical protein